MRPENWHEASESSCSLLDFEPEASRLLDTSTDLKNDLVYFIDVTRSVSEVEKVVMVRSIVYSSTMISAQKSISSPNNTMEEATDLSSYDVLRNVVGL